MTDTKGEVPFVARRWAKKPETEATTTEPPASEDYLDWLRPVLSRHEPVLDDEKYQFWCEQKRKREQELEELKRKRQQEQDQQRQWEMHQQMLDLMQMLDRYMRELEHYRRRDREREHTRDDSRSR